MEAIQFCYQYILEVDILRRNDMLAIFTLRKNETVCLYLVIYYLVNSKWSQSYLQTLHKKQKMKFSIKVFFSKCDQIRGFLRIWSYLLKKSLTENFIFRAVKVSK